MATFKEVEQAGWTEKAVSYDDHFAAITLQAVAPILDALGDVSGLKLLDVCCGTGHLAASAVARAAQVTGIDFASTMIDIAADKVPEAKFLVGDAENLELKDSSFDAVVCSFGLWHMAEPDRAIANIARVLKPGGGFVYTTWLPPTKGWDLFDIVVKAINTHGSMEVDLPPSPPPFRFADPEEAASALTAQGFGTVEFHEEMAIWSGTSGQEVLDLIYKAIVRTPMMIEAQDSTARDLIKREIVDHSEKLLVDGKISMRYPYALVSSVKL